MMRLHWLNKTTLPNEILSFIFDREIENEILLVEFTFSELTEKKITGRDGYSVRLS